MTFTFKDLEGGQAAEINQAISQLTGYGFVEDATPSEGGLPYAVDILEGRTYINGEEVTVEATSIDLAEYGEELTKPRKVIIYITPEGEFEVAAGEPATPKPPGKIRFETFQPSPPDFRDMEGIPVVEVWLGAHDQTVTDEDIRDRRLNSLMSGYYVDVETLDFETLIDGAGNELGLLTSLEEQLTQDDVRELINADPNHSQNADHDFFSGSHEDIYNPSSDDHHIPYTDSEAYPAIDGQVDLSELTGSGTPGNFLSSDSTGLMWDSPPMSQAPLLDTGVVTHTGGSSTEETITGVTPSQSAQFGLGVSLGVDSPSSWEADYGYSVSASNHWNEETDFVDVDLSLTWDTDPGAGNDLDLRYYVYEMTPDVVQGLYDDEMVVELLHDRDLSLSGLSVGEKATSPTYSDTSTPFSPSIGDIISVDDNELAAYVHDGSSWTGPFGEGVTSLSGLAIDAVKDWGGSRILNLGNPDVSTAILRETDLSSHGSDPDVHHEKTVSSDIDHANVSNVSSDDHHTRYTDSEAIVPIVEQSRDVSINATSINDGDSVRVHAAVDDNETLHLLYGMVVNDGGIRPSGLSLQISDLETGNLLYQQHSRTREGDMSNPLESIEGPAVLDIQVRNQTGNIVAASGTASYILEAS